jgi:HK97 family phage prohead protease
LSNLKYVIRESSDNKYLDFYASVFNHKSKPIVENGKKFVEVVERSAFNNTDTSNVVATLFHDKNKIIGRSRANTLTLTIDEKGLKASVLLGDTTLHRDTIEQVERGDLDECSFIATVDDWDEKYEDGVLVRYIKSIKTLKDVSIVSEGAYSDTNIKIITRDYSKGVPQSGNTEKKESEISMSENEIEELKQKVVELEKEIERSKEEEPEKEPEKEKEAEKEPEKEKEEKPKKEEKEAKKEPKKDEEKEVEREKQPEPIKDKTNEEKEVEKEVERSFQEEKKVINKMKNELDLVREAINTESAKNTIDISRAAGDGESSKFTKLTPVSVAKLDIVGKAPIWAEMGVDYMPGCSGTVTLPYEDPIIAEQLAELAPVTKQNETDNGTAVSAKRYQVTKVWTLETLANMTNEGLEAQINNLRQAIDRKITADVFNAVFTGAKTVSGVTAVDEAGIDSLVEKCDIDNEYSFVMSRSMFYNKKSTKIDSGSGINLMKKSGKFGQTFDGDKVYFSTLSPVKNKVAGGDFSKISVLDFEKEHVIIDNVTLSDIGQVKITAVKLANVALRNPNAFSVSGIIA